MTKMDHFTLRIPPEAVAEIEEIADRTYVPPRTLVRSWIMQRLDAENEKGE